VKLTNQLVKNAARPGGAKASPRKRGPIQPRRAARDGSRERIFAAAAHEFAAHGFAGGNVDRIATAAGLNKAMIYYHFSSKAALYREILRDMFGAVGARISAVAAAHVDPGDKIRRYVAAFAAEAQARPHFPPIWFREIADGGHHLDDATLGDITGVLKALAAIIEDGVRAKRFQPVSPFLVQGGIVAPLLLFFASATLLTRLDRSGAPGLSRIGPADVVAHVQRMTLGLLEGRV
jgi:AcrR family transcriptional regulator